MTTYKQAKEHPGVVLVEFFATWCPHCQRMMPVVEEVKELVAGKAAVFQYDIDKYPDDAEKAGADTVPTFIVFKDGKEVWRKVGEMPGDEIVQAITSALR